MKLHPYMLLIITSLFPNENPYERYRHMGIKGKAVMKDLMFLKKKDADSSPAPSIQLTSKEG